MNDSKARTNAKRMSEIEVRARVRKVEGWLHEMEGLLLYELAKKGSGKGAIVEIGSWKGKSTIWLASGSKSPGREKVFAVDPHTGSKEHGEVQTFDEFKRNIRLTGVDDYVVPLNMTSEEAERIWKGDIRLLWIDGSHEYKDVRKDFLLWQQNLTDDGVIALHDSYFAWVWPGPTRVAQEFIVGNPFFVNVGFVISVTFAKKSMMVSLFQRARKVFLFHILQFFERVVNLGIRAPWSVKFLISALLNLTDPGLYKIVLPVYYKYIFAKRDKE